MNLDKTLDALADLVLEDLVVILGGDHNDTFFAGSQAMLFAETTEQGSCVKTGRSVSRHLKGNYVCR